MFLTENFNLKKEEVLCTPQQQQEEGQQGGGGRKRTLEHVVLTADVDTKQRKCSKSSSSYQEEAKRMFRPISFSTSSSPPTTTIAVSITPPGIMSEISCSSPTPRDDPPKTPIQSLQAKDMNCSEVNILPGDSLHCSFSVSLKYHDASNVCPEGGVVHLHKGIEPGHPKGYYCCLNAELASRQHSLQVVDNGVLMEVYGPIGVVAYVEAGDASLIRKELQHVSGQIGQTSMLCAEQFLQDRHCEKINDQDYAFTRSTWNAKVRIYTRPTINLTKCPAGKLPPSFLCCPTPIRRCLFTDDGDNKGDIRNSPFSHSFRTVSMSPLTLVNSLF